MTTGASEPQADHEDYLRDILDNIEKVERFTAGVGFDAFIADDKTAYAVIRALEIIGEAVKQLPETLYSEYPEIPWRDIARMRDKLIHKYFGVNLAIVWKTITESLPELKPVIRAMLQQGPGSMAPDNESPSGLDH